MEVASELGLEVLHGLARKLASFLEVYVVVFFSNFEEFIDEFVVCMLDEC